jgi:hypothetical protein
MIELVELYATVVYSNNGISTAPLANTYLLFSSALNGGIYIFLPLSAQLPYGLAVDFGYGGVPQLYSNSAADRQSERKFHPCARWEISVSGVRAAAGVFSGPDR